MTVPYSVNDNDTLLPLDVNQYKNLLEGATGYTTSFALKSTAGADFVITLGDSAATNKLVIKDAAGNTVAYIDSDGNISGNLLATSSSLIIPQSATPTQTAEGSIAWDTDDDVLTVGTGSATKRIGSYNLAASVNTPTSTTSTSAVDLVTISGLSIPVTSGIKIIFNFRKQALAAQAVGFGLKLNSTVVYEAGGSGVFETSADNQAEDGMGVIEITPRSAATYLGGMTMYYTARVSSSRAPSNSTPKFVTAAATNPIPNAVITSIAIRAVNETSNNAAEVSSVQVWTLG